jgi:hypothetical protein
MGLYYEQVKRYLETFPKEQLRIYWYENYQAKPVRTLSDMFRFLEVDPAFRPDISKRYLESGLPDVALDPADRAFLIDFYREDIGKLADLLKHDLSSWCGL